MRKILFALKPGSETVLLLHRSLDVILARPLDIHLVSFVSVLSDHDQNAKVEWRIT